MWNCKNIEIFIRFGCGQSKCLDKKIFCFYPWYSVLLLIKITMVWVISFAQIWGFVSPKYSLVCTFKLLHRGWVEQKSLNSMFFCAIVSVFAVACRNNIYLLMQPLNLDTAIFSTCALSEPADMFSGIRADYFSKLCWYCRKNNESCGSCFSEQYTAFSSLSAHVAKTNSKPIKGHK